jgi:hypothetical protein
VPICFHFVSQRFSFTLGVVHHQEKAEETPELNGRFL